MHRSKSHSAWPRRAATAALCATAWGAWAQNAPAAETFANTAARAASAATGGTAVTAPPLTLKQAFDSAWARQPEALGLAARRDAAQAAQQASRAWTPEPAALELSNKTDRFSRDQGRREIDIGIGVPLWLPGERSRSAALATVQGQAVESHRTAAQLRVAAAVREAWWLWQRAHIDLQMARAHVDNASRIAADVARRQQAGDLARSDRHQADGAVAAAQSLLAQAESAAVAARLQLQALTGQALPEQALAGPTHSPTGLPNSAAFDSAPPTPDLGPPRAAEVEPGAKAPALEMHPSLVALTDQAEIAQRSAALASTQSRASPELTLSTTRERSAFGEPSQQTVTLGIRVPFGGGPRHRARVASALADSTELQAQLNLERDRLQAERDTAQARLQAARAQVLAAERRALLASESRGFFDKSFRLGETDLPTRLRVEAEATEAERQAARARVDLAAAISAQRQALGLLPD